MSGQYVALQTTLPFSDFGFARLWVQMTTTTTIVEVDLQLLFRKESILTSPPFTFASESFAQAE